MKQEKNNDCQTVIAGGGIAGLTCALELLESGQQVIIVDRDTQERLGGLARWAFGGMALNGTKQQDRMKIQDSAELLLKDWHSFAEFSEQDQWPKLWAKLYAEKNNEMVYQWLAKLGLKFLPAVNWVERGLYTPGNSLPRYHVLWGTGWQLVEAIIEKLQPFIKQEKLKIYSQHKVIKPLVDPAGENVVAVKVEDETNHDVFTIKADSIVIACGGINGSTERVKANWYKPWGDPPKDLLNGANPISDGKLHDQVQLLGGNVTHQDKMWNYAAGINHPQAEFPGHGLSLIPCKSALWMDHQGKRIGPQPLVTGFDTHYLCQQVAKQKKPWTWQILNWDIAIKELAVSGSQHNPSIKNKKMLSVLKELLFGNQRLVMQLAEECEDVIVADSIEELSMKMNELTDNCYIKIDYLKQQILNYDKQFTQGKSLQNDDQIRRIQHARQWRPDKLRTCQPSAILTNKNGKAHKLIAIKLQLISRKSLGGIQTNLNSEVLDDDGHAISGLYAIGEAAGFGGGGANGKRSLEGTFLSGCILTARIAAQAILKCK